MDFLTHAVPGIAPVVLPAMFPCLPCPALIVSVLMPCLCLCLGLCLCLDFAPALLSGPFPSTIVPNVASFALL